MKAFIPTITALTLALSLAACGDDETTSTSLKLNGAEYATVGTTSLTTTDTSVSGVGSIVFNAALSGGSSSDHDYALTFTLTDGGSLTLVTNATTSLANGPKIQFTRAGSTLTVAAISVSGTSTDISNSFSTIDAAGTITLYADVHNTEASAHVLIGTGTSTDTILFNSEDASVDVGKGQGAYWGLQLNNATVTAATVADKLYTVE